MLIFRPTPHTTAFLLFLTFYILLVLDVRYKSWRDPGSIFFDPEKAFDAEYSLLRIAQSSSHIKSVGEQTEYFNQTKAGPNPSFCVGTTTLQREGARYFQRHIGSLLAGLTEVERQDLWLQPFIVNYDPEEHIAFNEDWLDAVSDRVLTYKDARPEVRAHVESFATGDFMRKAPFDYSYLLRSCYETGLPWVMMLEDDTIAAEGWYYRMRLAVQELAQQKDFDKMLYLRLFYNERILGWNSEEWFGYLIWSLSIEALVFGVLFCALRYGPPEAKTALSPRTSTVVLGVCTPMLLGLYFAAGRLTVSPFSRGLHRMPNYGCCSQAFVFPRHRIPALLEFYDAYIPGGAYVDSLTEFYGTKEGLVRWALTPSVFQHAGATSSKDTTLGRWGRTDTANIWNFSFEKFKAEELKDEHFG